jgi:hypothetical protein
MTQKNNGLMINFGTPNHIANYILITISALLLIWVIAIPPFQNPDEGAHYIKTCANPIVEQNPDRGYGHYFNSAMASVNEAAQVQPVRRGEATFSFAEYFSEPVGKSEDTIFYRHAVPNTLIPYFIPHIACKIIEQTDVSYQLIFYILKISFALSFLLFIYFLKKLDTPLFLSLAPLLAIPMVINQSAALSADYFSIAAAGYFGITIGMMIKKQAVSALQIGLAVFLILNSKIVYAPLLLAMLPLILLDHKKYFSMKYIFPVMVFFLSALILQFYYQTHKTAMPHMEARTIEQLQRLQVDPWLFFQMLFKTMVTYSEFYLRGLMGYAGWITIPISKILMQLGIATLLLWLVFSVTKKLVFYKNQIPLILATFSGLSISFLLIFLSMLLYWTHPEKSLIEGVQGRYFLPLLFFFFPIAFSFRNNDKIHLELIAPFVIMVAVTVIFLLQSVLPAFHGIHLLR